MKLRVTSGLLKLPSVNAESDKWIIELNIQPNGSAKWFAELNIQQSQHHYSPFNKVGLFFVHT